MAAIQHNANNQKKRRRGRPKIDAAAQAATPTTGLRVSAEMLGAVVQWAKSQPDRPTKAEAFRRLVDLGLSASASSRPHSPETRAKAAALAHEVIDRHLDPPVSSDEREAQMTADEFNTNRQRALAAWAKATKDERESALIDGTAFIDKNFQFRGEPEFKSQSLSWPRKNAFYDDGSPIRGVPDQVKEATSVVASFMVANVPMDVDTMAHIFLVLGPVIQDNRSH